MTKLSEMSATMAACLAFIEAARNEHGGKIVRFPGGYWTHAGCDRNGRRPSQYFGTPTIEALVKRGWLRYSRWQEATAPARSRSFPVEAEIVPP